MVRTGVVLVLCCAAPFHASCGCGLYLYGCVAVIDKQPEFLQLRYPKGKHREVCAVIPAYPGHFSTSCLHVSGESAAARGPSHQF